ncbi:hypothetical protein AAC387_Pa05g3637 [Persea americana]|eukprot:TRINITY_DN62316_c0_g1_i1.p1 TRINITY_DN62316_c0_g1~~TRINITY_DN62316_c0_g1_i1.p1  ORF type:complete len:197 (+),score=33.04 TRINITY_DN62316_c0_g1_i1:147-737(+)
METNNTTATAACPAYPISPPASSISTLAFPPIVVASPCAACRVLRRKCTDKCVLAPYFPPMDPLKFTSAHKVFGASNISKLLQQLPESHRADAVSSMVYEANARIRDPVYGCAGAICQLQKQVSQLQTQLAKAKAELLNMQTQRANLVAIVCMETAHSQAQILQDSAANPHMIHPNNDGFIDDSSNLGSVWEPLWT